MTETMNIENLYYIRHLVVNLVTLFPVKATLAVFLGVFLYVIGADHLEAAEALLFLILADFAMAWMSAFRRGIPIQSSKALRTGIKISVYFLLAASAFIAERPTGLPFLAATTYAFLSLTELISVLEHASELGFDTPRRLLNQLRDVKNGQGI